jgi:transposase-like protein
MKRKDKRMHPEHVGAGSSGGKRRHVLTIQQKVEVLRKIDRGVSVSRLHRDYGVGQSTIYDIKAQKNQIVQFVAESDSMAGTSRRKTLRGPSNIDLDKVVYEWFRQCRSEGIPISIITA